MSSAKGFLFVDSIEGGFCRVLWGDEEILFYMPVGCFPKDVKEGDWYDMTLENDTRRREAGLKEIADLLKELGNDLSPLEGD